MHTRIFAFICCLGFMVGSVTHASAYPATIIRVMDGDTVIVEPESAQHRPIIPSSRLFLFDWLTDSPARRTVRLYGIDCPEKKQAYGNQSAKLTRAFSGQQVDVRDIYTDSYGRSVAVLRLDDDSTLQEHLLRSGAAWLYPKYCKSSICTAWKRLEQEARDKRLGLWKDDTPQAPWQWRKLHTTVGE